MLTVSFGYPLSVGFNSFFPCVYLKLSKGSIIFDVGEWVSPFCGPSNVNIKRFNLAMNYFAHYLVIEMDFKSNTA
jgi:hypothetical protein